MSDNQPINNSWEEWMIDPLLSSGQQLYASGATVSGQIGPRISASNTGEETINPQSLNVFTEHICYRCSPFKTFNRHGDLTRHLNEKHNPVTTSKYLCPINLCPRGIQGEGFGRMHHLVAHLKSKKPEMGGREALHLARLHNLPKSKGQTAAQSGS